MEILVIALRVIGLYCIAFVLWRLVTQPAGQRTPTVERLNLLLLSICWGLLLGPLLMGCSSSTGATATPEIAGPCPGPSGQLTVGIFLDENGDVVGTVEVLR